MNAILWGQESSLLPGNPGYLAVIVSGSSRMELIEREWDTQRASLLIIGCADWNRLLSPWPAPACFRNGEDFSGEASMFLHALLTEILPEAEKRMRLENPVRAITGYSLAGLFALYAQAETDVFSMAASVSGSLWYDNFLSYLTSRPPNAGRIYLSLGDQEEKTKNRRLALVGECTRNAYRYFESLGIDTQYKINPGNHFFESEKRMLHALNALFP